MQIAPQHAKAVGQGPGVRMKKRLLLDGIALHPTNIAPRNIQLATLVVADFADSRLAFCNGTAMSAGEAANAISLDLLVQLAFTDVPIQNITERRQLKPLYLFYRRCKDRVKGRRAQAETRKRRK